MDTSFYQRLDSELEQLRAQGLFKNERVISSPQGGQIRVNDADVVNLCANNYLGLANHPAIREAAHRALDRYGYGMASVRFICGTQDLHKQLEAALSPFLGTEDTILYSSCWDANGGLFETVLGEEDAIITDALNHASIIDGIRLCKAQRLRYANNDLDELEKHLKDTQDCRTRAHRDRRRVLDGRQHRATCARSATSPIVTTRSSWSTTRMRRASWARAAAARPNTAASLGRIDIITGTLGKALGGGSGGYTCGAGNAIAWLAAALASLSVLEQLPPVVAAVTLRALDMVEHIARSCARSCSRHARYFRAGMQSAGFDLVPGEHPIIPVMLGDAAARGAHGRPAARRRHLRHRLLVSGRAEGRGAHPHADVGRRSTERSWTARSRLSPRSVRAGARVK